MSSEKINQKNALATRIPWPPPPCPDDPGHPGPFPTISKNAGETIL